MKSMASKWLRVSSFMATAWTIARRPSSYHCFQRPSSGSASAGCIPKNPSRFTPLRVAVLSGAGMAMLRRRLK